MTEPAATKVMFSLARNLAALLPVTSISPLPFRSRTNGSMVRWWALPGEAQFEPISLFQAEEMEFGHQSMTRRQSLSFRPLTSPPAALRTASW
ncbi:hypothetical protein D3C86_1736600 [compost metagenome]